MARKTKADIGSGLGGGGSPGDTGNSLGYQGESTGTGNPPEAAGMDPSEIDQGGDPGSNMVDIGDMEGSPGTSEGGVSDDSDVSDDPGGFERKIKSKKSTKSKGKKSTKSKSKKVSQSKPGFSANYDQGGNKQPFGQVTTKAQSDPIKDTIAVQNALATEGRSDVRVASVPVEQYDTQKTVTTTRNIPVSSAPETIIEQTQPVPLPQSTFQDAQRQNQSAQQAQGQGQQVQRKAFYAQGEINPSAPPAQVSGKPIQKGKSFYGEGEINPSAPPATA